MKKVELISPAGNFEKAKIAFHYGADAIYLGGKLFNLRKRAGNLSYNEIEQIVKLAKGKKKEVYLTLNIFFRNDDFKELKEYLLNLYDIGIRNLIVSDIGCIYFINKNFKDRFNLTLSTQANLTNIYAAEFYKELGLKRVTLARELSLNEIKEIKSKVNIEVETFIHGAMCMSYSGRCILSEYFTGRSANRGDCSQPCRWEYVLKEKRRDFPVLDIEEDERGTYLLSSKDLCMIEDISKLIEAGIDSFKIEGRMKSIYYVANTTRVYRDAIDSFYKGDVGKMDIWREELDSFSHRPYFKGFYFGYNGASLSFDKNYKRHYKFIGYITDKFNEQTYEVKIMNKLKSDDKIEIILPNMKNIKEIDFKILDKDFKMVDEANINEKYYLDFDNISETVDYGIIRVKE